MPKTKATGRPAVYCTPACRRSAEYAIRRAQILLTRAQRAQQDAALRVAMSTSAWDIKDAEPRAAFWEGEVERLRTSLRELLEQVGTQDDESTPGTTDPRP
ncbi:hypothetical protein [Pedococcus bigeumensis]|uniref:Uncharacterized protein n=1 Tax=Pedococcus bigeumensis TaxID=433644 RepID=A0A502CIB6_9MICO|nr:hypothetical protein [Pedococcus bigeumensis]TPG12563.1 hypothetical protein EAH86_19860 [Pedococcus bigeumensis]